MPDFSACPRPQNEMLKQMQVFCIAKTASRAPCNQDISKSHLISASHRVFFGRHSPIFQPLIDEVTSNEELVDMNTVHVMPIENSVPRRRLRPRNNTPFD